jgi:hypothetical protein
LYKTKNKIMKKSAIVLIVLISLLMGNILKAQNVGISNGSFTPDASAGLEIRFTDKGLLIPRVALMSTSSASPITSPATSLLVYNTATTGDVTPGYYYWTGSKWMRLLAIDDKVSWLLTGNAGTTPATNFLGTTDAQPLVIRTNNTERSRILSNGQVLINRTAADYSGDLLEVQGNSTYPYAINGLSDQASGAGVYGYNSASSGTGVIGAGNNQTASYLTAGSGGAFSSTNVGVYGYGDTTSRSYGVLGRSAAADGIGILADISATAGDSTGCGLVAYSNQSGGFGAWGINQTANGTGVVGVGNNQTASYLTAGSGGAFTGSNTGSYGKSTSARGTGVIGVGNNQTANVLTNGSGGAFTGDSIGVYGYAIKSGNRTWGGYFKNNSTTAYAYVGGRIGDTDYKINGTGTVSTIVKNTTGDRVNLYCPETPEIFFQDYGDGQLVNGKAHIELDPDFAKNVTINEKHPLRVFIQLEDDCYGVYVTNKTKTGFDVIELNGGSSNAKFMWTVTANRADEVDENGNIISKYADVRFAPAPGPLESVETKETKANSKEIMKNSKEIKEVESLDKKDININKTNNQ